MKRNYVIPTNFMETGYVMNGAVSIRNAIEGGILALLGFFLCKILPIPSGVDGISYYILICLPLGMVGALGVQGDPLSVFIWDFFKWRKRRKPFFYSGHSEAYTMEAADMLMEAPQFRDYLADTIDKVRRSFAAEEIDYVEGETFRFAEDPEQAALRYAQEELQNKRDAELAEALAAKAAKEQAAAARPKPAPKQEPTGQAKQGNARSIADKLVLEDLNWEEGD